MRTNVRTISDLMKFASYRIGDRVRHAVTNRCVRTTNPEMTKSRRVRRYAMHLTKGNPKGGKTIVPVETGLKSEQVC